jgi:hypothetical protein
MAEKPKKRWFEEIAEQLDQVQPPAELKEFLDIDGYPPWLVNVCKELFQQATPSAKLTTFKTDTPKSVGLWLGQNLANFHAVDDTLSHNLALVENNPEKVAAFQKALEARADQPDVQNLMRTAETTGHLLSGFESEASELQKMAAQACGLAIEQGNYQECAEFFQGFAKGLSNKGLKGNQLARTSEATNIYMAMLYNWKTVDSFKTVSMLRDFLLKIGFTESQLGDPERLKKLCYRVKYHPGKRGRPPKKQK